MTTKQILVLVGVFVISLIAFTGVFGVFGLFGNVGLGFGVAVPVSLSITGVVYFALYYSSRGASKK